MAAAAWVSERKRDKVVTLREEMEATARRAGVWDAVAAVPVVHIAGTKGKGSTGAFLEALSLDRGLRTGVFSSPHCVSLCERVRLDGVPISEDAFVRAYVDFLAKDPDGLTKLPFFRFLTLLSMYIFAQEKVDIAIVEVGIGGRADATNFVLPRVCGITALGYDHQDVLGDTIEEIAAEKAGICKKGVPAYTVEQHRYPQTASVLASVAVDAGTTMRTVPAPPPAATDVTLGLAGKHQRENAALACALFNEFVGGVAPRATLSSPALSTARLAGRSHVLRDEGRDLTLYLDGAHTVESLDAVAAWFTETVPASEPRHLIFNCATSRSPDRLLAPLRPLSFASAHFSTYRLDADDGYLKEKGELLNDADGVSWQREQASVWGGTETAVHQTVGGALDAVPRGSHVLVTGSFYLVGAVLELLHFTPDPRSSAQRSSQ